MIRNEDTLGDTSQDRAPAILGPPAGARRRVDFDLGETDVAERRVFLTVDELFDDLESP